MITFVSSSSGSHNIGISKYGSSNCDLFRYGFLVGKYRSYWKCSLSEEVLLETTKMMMAPTMVLRMSSVSYEIPFSDRTWFALRIVQSTNYPRLVFTSEQKEITRYTTIHRYFTGTHVNYDMKHSNCKCIYTKQTPLGSDGVKEMYEPITFIIWSTDDTSIIYTLYIYYINCIATFW